MPGPLVEAKNTRKKASLYTHVKVDAIVLQSFLEKIHQNTVTMEDYSSIFKLTVKDKKLFEYLNASILLHSLEENTNIARQ
jgi:hypothetical protein